MNKNLGWKAVLIAGTLLVFLVGIFEIPLGVSEQELCDVVQDRVNLGLDRDGGTHLILQAQVNDGVKVECENAIQRLKESLRTHNINYAEISQPAAANRPEQIVIKGVPPE